MTSLRIRRLYNVSRCLDSELVDGFARCALQSFDENATQENAPLNAEADEISARTGLRAKRRHQLRLVARAMHCGETDVVGSNPVVTCKKRPPLSKLEPEQLKRAPSVKPTRCAVDRDWSPSACVRARYRSFQDTPNAEHPTMPQVVALEWLGQRIEEIAFQTSLELRDSATKHRRMPTPRRPTAEAINGNLSLPRVKIFQGIAAAGRSPWVAATALSGGAAETNVDGQTVNGMPAESGIFSCEHAWQFDISLTSEVQPVLRAPEVDLDDDVTNERIIRRLARTV